MRPILFLLFMVMIISACEKPDEVLPVPPVPTGQAAASETKVPEKKSQSGTNSELYQYGKIKHMPYRILVPRNYDAAKTYPMLLFLHGIGERGTDNEQQLTLGASLFQADSIRNKYPSFIVFPQCPTAHYWFDDKEMNTLKDLIDTLDVMYQIDEKKIYIGGLSMGAYGTYAMVAENPGLFAAAVAISGDGDANKAPLMAKTKWRIFAGKKDDVVSSSKSEKMATALKNSGASVSFTLYPQADHSGSWVNAFSEPDFCSWLFSISQNNDQVH
jgi:predicted peptidase